MNSVELANGGMSHFLKPTAVLCCFWLVSVDQESMLKQPHLVAALRIEPMNP